jgi:hypothetical protein
MHSLELSTSPLVLKKQATQLYKSAVAAKEKLARVGQANQKTMDGLIDVALVTGAAFGVSWLNGKYGDPATGTPYKVAGFEVDIAAAGVLLGAAFFDVLGEKYSPHLFTAAGGCASAYATRLGLAQGAKKAA